MRMVVLPVVSLWLVSGVQSFGLELLSRARIDARSPLNLNTAIALEPGALVRASSGLDVSQI